MARGVNKVILIGNLGRDPELRYTQRGTAVCNMRLATNESYQNQEEETVQRTEWHDVVVWDRLAEICDEHLEKGSQVYFEGKLQTREWEDQDGNTRYSTEVKARNVMFLGRGPQGRLGGQGPERDRPETRTSEGGQTHRRGAGPTQSSSPGEQSGTGQPGADDSGAEESDEESVFEPDDDLPF